MRQSGILLHITSLPGPEGCGTLGQEAREFVDFLAQAGMSIWQVLPISPTGYGESPYQSFSTFAGNTNMIDLRTLVEEGLLSNLPPFYTQDMSRVDFPNVMIYKEDMLRLAYREGRAKVKAQQEAFRKEQAHWLEDYALFRAIKRHFNNLSWMDWPDEALRKRYPDAMAFYRAQFADEIDFQVFTQYLFFRQWSALKAYANGKGIQLFGDMPIYVAMDSADTWANPQCFQLDINRRPRHVAGVPPDYFSQDGQLWGNPLYAWKAHRKNRYAWWLQRLSAMGSYFDLIRVDHFIGFANYYAVRYGSRTARWGRWRIGPGRHFFERVKKALPDIGIIAEDLGAVNDRVRKLLRFCGYPGMKVLCFAFTGGDDNVHLPQHVTPNSVYYTGTHDNNTVLGWWEAAPDYEKGRARYVLNMKENDHICDKMMEAVFMSRAQRAMVPMQDVLHLPASARMNLPGTLGSNWLWRMSAQALTPELARKLKELNVHAKRA